ncbi:MAG: hypothetical protein ACFE8A_04180 [Candidatus Hodarchaeota archaeon]
MQKCRILLYGLLLASFFVSYIVIAKAEKKPEYVGIDEGVTYIWKTEFDKGPLEDYYEDLGKTETEAELEADEDFDLMDWNEKDEGRKIYIVDIREEKEDSVGTEEYDRVKFIYNMYKTKDINDPEAWKKMEKYETSKIFEPDEELYSAFIPYTMGLSAFFLPKNLKFYKIVNEIEDSVDDTGDEDRLSIDTTKRTYFFAQQEVGITTEYNNEYSSEVEDFGSISKYTTNWILYYYEFSYDGDVIARFELDTIGGTYLRENWWWMVLLAGAICIVMIILIIIIKVKKR